MSTPQQYPSSVRLPSHIDPPYRAVQWWQQVTIQNASLSALYQTRWSTTTATTGTTGQYAQGEPFPVGHRGELTYLEFHVATLLAGVGFLAAAALTSLSILRNGSIVPGFGGLRPSLETVSTLTEATGPYNRVGRSAGPQVLVPIHLSEFDRLDMEVTISSGSNWNYTLRWGGWFYPVQQQGDEGSIRGTAQDPGVRHPLRFPLFR